MRRRLLGSGKGFGGVVGVWVVVAEKGRRTRLQWKEDRVDCPLIALLPRKSRFVSRRVSRHRCSQMPKWDYVWSTKSMRWWETAFALPKQDNGVLVKEVVLELREKARRLEKVVRVHWWC